MRGRLPIESPSKRRIIDMIGDVIISGVIVVMCSLAAWFLRIE